MGLLRGWLDRFDDWQARVHARRAVAGMERTADPVRRMTRGQAWALSGYFAALLASDAWLAHTVASPVRVLAALLPLPFIAVLVALSVRRVQALDELQRRIELAALAVVATGTWLGLGVCWLLGRAGMSVPPAQLGFGAMALLYVFARRWAGRRYT